MTVVVRPQRRDPLLDGPVRLDVTVTDVPTVG